VPTLPLQGAKDIFHINQQNHQRTPRNHGFAQPTIENPCFFPLNQFWVKNTTFWWRESSGDVQPAVPAGDGSFQLGGGS